MKDPTKYPKENKFTLFVPAKNTIANVTHRKDNKIPLLKISNQVLKKTTLKQKMLIKHLKQYIATFLIKSVI